MEPKQVKGVDKMDYKNELPKTISVKEFAEIYNIGINKAYEIVNCRDFPMIRNGRKVIIITSKIDEWLFSKIGTSI